MKKCISILPIYLLTLILTMTYLPAHAFSGSGAIEKIIQDNAKIKADQEKQEAALKNREANEAKREAERQSKIEKVKKEKEAERKKQAEQAAEQAAIQKAVYNALHKRCSSKGNIGKNYITIANYKMGDVVHHSSGYSLEDCMNQLDCLKGSSEIKYVYYFNTIDTSKIDMSKIKDKTLKNLLKIGGCAYHKEKTFEFKGPYDHVMGLINDTTLYVYEILDPDETL